MRVREAQVLVQVVQAVEEVAHVPAEHAQDALVAVAADVLDERVPHEAHHLGERYAQHADGRFEELRHDRLAVALLGDERRMFHPGNKSNLIGSEIDTRVNINFNTRAYVCGCSFIAVTCFVCKLHCTCFGETGPNLECNCCCIILL